MEDNTSGIWTNARHATKGSVTANYYCRPVPPSPSSALHNEVSSLIKLIIYFIICAFSSLSISTVMATQLSYSNRIPKSKERSLSQSWNGAMDSQLFPIQKQVKLEVLLGNKMLVCLEGSHWFSHRAHVLLVNPINIITLHGSKPCFDWTTYASYRHEHKV